MNMGYVWFTSNLHLVIIDI